MHRAWAPKRGGLAGIWETQRILRRAGLTGLARAAPSMRLVGLRSMIIPLLDKSLS